MSYILPCCFRYFIHRRKSDNCAAAFFISEPRLPNEDYMSHYSSSIPVAIESAILFGLNNDLGTVQGQTNSSCSSADCYWSAYKSLAICSECNGIPFSSMAPIQGNVTNLLQAYLGLYEPGHMSGYVTRGTVASGWRLPNGQFFANMEQNLTALGRYTTSDLKKEILEMTAKSTGDPKKTLTPQHRENLLWAVSVMHFKDTMESRANWPGSSIVAKECGRYWCVNQYQSSVAKNTYSESKRSIRAEGPHKMGSRWQMARREP